MICLLLTQGEGVTIVAPSLSWERRGKILGRDRVQSLLPGWGTPRKRGVVGEPLLSPLKKKGEVRTPHQCWFLELPPPREPREGKERKKVKGEENYLSSMLTPSLRRGKRKEGKQASLKETIVPSSPECTAPKVEKGKKGSGLSLRARGKKKVSCQRPDFYVFPSESPREWGETKGGENSFDLLKAWRGKEEN